MKYIGGFFELETNISSHGKPFHTNALAFQSGRSGLNYIIQQLSPSKIFLPFYCCDSLIEPLIRSKIPYEFYSIDSNFMPIDKIDLKKDQYIVYVNYFGVFKKNVKILYRRYKSKLILDNTQAFFEFQYKDCCSFNSARKFFGVPDGSYVYLPRDVSGYEMLPRNTKISLLHLKLRLRGDQSKAYKRYLQYEKTIDSGLKKISAVSEEILKGLDYESIRTKRKSNFQFYHRKLAKLNRLRLNVDAGAVPHYYPFLPNIPVDRLQCSKAGIFIPTFWPDVLTRKMQNFYFEKKLAKELLLLPIDHRYTEKDCAVVVATLGQDLNINKS